MSRQGNITRSQLGVDYKFGDRTVQEKKKDRSGFYDKKTDSRPKKKRASKSDNHYEPKIQMTLSEYREDRVRKGLVVRF